MSATGPEKSAKDVKEVKDNPALRPERCAVSEVERIHLEQAKNAVSSDDAFSPGMPAPGAPCPLPAAQPLKYTPEDAEDGPLADKERPV